MTAASRACGQPAGDLAQRRVLAREGALAELAAQQPQQRPQPLERLARLVHALLARARAVASASALEREVDLAERPCAAARAPAARRARARAGARCRRWRARAALALGARHHEADADRDAGRDTGAERRHNGAVPSLPRAPWWTVRPAANRKPATYRCPICGHSSARSERAYADRARRRHAPAPPRAQRTACSRRARAVSCPCARTGCAPSRAGRRCGRGCCGRG